jgi:transmembrane sensor
MKLPSGSGSPRPSDDESIAATAAAWLAQRDDTFSPADAAAFERWCAADPRHAAAVARLENAWATLLPLRDFRPAAQRHPDRDLLAAPAPRPARLPAPARAFAFALAASLILALGVWAFRANSPTSTRFATTAGGYERVILTDSSVLELNGDSAAEVTYTAAERRVRLTRGEAHFTVAKNPARPFRVEALGIAVRAVGTAFNVRLGAGEVEVLVTEGKVSVSEVERVVPNALVPVAEPSPTRWGQRVPPSDTLLITNERAIVATNGPVTPPRVERIAPEAVRTALIWQGPSLVFAATPLAEVAAQFNRRNPIQIVLADPALATLPIGGSFRPENVEAFVQLLESGNEILVDRSDATRLVLRSAK